MRKICQNVSHPMYFYNFIWQETDTASSIVANIQNNTDYLWQLGDQTITNMRKIRIATELCLYKIEQLNK